MEYEIDYSIFKQSNGIDPDNITYSFKIIGLENLITNNPNSVS